MPLLPNGEWAGGGRAIGGTLWIASTSVINTTQDESKLGSARPPGAPFY